MRLPLWIPQKDRAPKAKALRNRNGREGRRDNQTASARRKRDKEART
jgi:hypothetical protein